MRFEPMYSRDDSSPEKNYSLAEVYSVLETEVGLSRRVLEKIADSPRLRRLFLVAITTLGIGLFSGHETVPRGLIGDNALAERGTLPDAKK